MASAWGKGAWHLFPTHLSAPTHRVCRKGRGVWAWRVAPPYMPPLRMPPLRPLPYAYATPPTPATSPRKAEPSALLQDLFVEVTARVGFGVEGGFVQGAVQLAARLGNNGLNLVGRLKGEL